MIGKLKLVISDYLYGLNFKEDDFYELRKKGFVKLSPLKDDDINNLVKEIDSLDYDDEVTSTSILIQATQDFSLMKIINFIQLRN